jgi:hypothetical protein
MSAPNRTNCRLSSAPYARRRISTPRNLSGPRLPHSFQRYPNTQRNPRQDHPTDRHRRQRAKLEARNNVRINKESKRKSDQEYRRDRQRRKTSCEIHPPSVPLRPPRQIRPRRPNQRQHQQPRQIQNHSSRLTRMRDYGLNAGPNDDGHHSERSQQRYQTWNPDLLHSIGHRSLPLRRIHFSPQLVPISGFRARLCIRFFLRQSLTTQHGVALFQMLSQFRRHIFRLALLDPQRPKPLLHVSTPVTHASPSPHAAARETNPPILPASASASSDLAATTGSSAAFSRSPLSPTLRATIRDAPCGTARDTMPPACIVAPPPTAPRCAARSHTRAAVLPPERSAPPVPPSRASVPFVS